ncbi:recombinase family protein [Sutcliffiella horikoshii]|uniref:recombinase family protein n=1 Tax=Sutcliffiella horikoshii TaxID=79883 RepID=UPI003CF313E6
MVRKIIDKYMVFFRRVSTTTQDLAMQESADALYRDKFLEKEILILNEDGISANKLKIEHRPQMQRLINLIINNQIDTVFAFDRTRLFRDFYEAIFFVSLCKEHSVKIFFTSPGHQQATDSTLLEGVMNIIGDVEGKNIARRTEEARKRYPPRKLGYIKHKESKQYKKDPIKKDLLHQFFLAIHQVTTLKEMEVVLKEYKKSLKTTTNQLIKICSDPFYAGFDLTSGKNRLQHVEPYISYEDFNKYQSNNTVLLTYQKIERLLEDQDIYSVSCGICGKSMKFQLDVPTEKSWYSCSKKHPKISIGTEELSKIINLSLEKIIEHIDAELLLKDSQYYFGSIQKTFNTELKSLETKRNKVLEKVILETGDLNNWRENPHYVELTKLEANQRDYINKLEVNKGLLFENETVVKLVKDYLHNCRQKNVFFLSTMLIKNLFIYPNEVDIEVSKFDYLQNFKTQYIFKGDDLI